MMQGGNYCEPQIQHIRSMT